MRIFCKVDGRDGIIVGAAPGFHHVGGKSTPCTKLLVILAGERFMSAVGLNEAEIYGAPKRFRKLHKKLLRRADSVQP